VVRARRELIEASEELVRRDPAFGPVVEAAGPCTLRSRRPTTSDFGQLAASIVYQQLAGRAAAAIHARVTALFDGPPTADAVLALPVEALRAAGLSGAKAASVRDLAEKVRDGVVELDRIGRLGDDDVVRELTTVRGIGRWTAEMFLMFQLGRVDVWPVDDYGVRKGYAQLHSLDPLPKPRELEAMGERYRPFRSVAAWYCWRAVDTVTLP
jgi:3-methyladenine DNA glycosylase/8-oxoguanine DNA glycosylase